MHSGPNNTLLKHKSTWFGTICEEVSFIPTITAGITNFSLGTYIDTLERYIHSVYSGYHTVLPNHFPNLTKQITNF